MKHLLLALMITLTALACNNSSSKDDRLKLATEYYQALNESDFQKLSPLFLDSVRIKDGDYAMSYSIEAYQIWFQWDSVFHPSYKILEVKGSEDHVELTVSKACVRTLFLNKKPVVTKEIIRFKDDKIYDMEVASYIDFDNPSWDANREKLVTWIQLYHPELNGFIHDQTLEGAIRYTSALNFYKAEYEKENGIN